MIGSKGFDTAKVRAITSNICINPQGREPNGTVSPADYLALQQQFLTALRELVDTCLPSTGHGGGLRARSWEASAEAQALSARRWCW